MTENQEWDFYLLDGNGNLKVSRGDEATRSIIGDILASNLPWNENLDGKGKYGNNKERIDLSNFRGPKKSDGKTPDIDPSDDRSPTLVPNPFPKFPGVPRPDSIPNPWDFGHKPPPDLPVKKIIDVIK